MIKNKKAQGLALRTVVVLAVLLVVLVVVLGFFLGKTGQMFGPLGDLVTGTSEGLPKGECAGIIDDETGDECNDDPDLKNDKEACKLVDGCYWSYI